MYYNGDLGKGFGGSGRNSEFNHGQVRPYEEIYHEPHKQHEPWLETS
jgi:hypothetical protein